MSRSNHHRVGLAVAVGTLSLAGSAGVATATTPPTPPTTSAPTTTALAATSSATTGPTSTLPATTMVGAPSGLLCGALPAEGEGSVMGMADDPASVAVTNNPALSRLAAAVTATGLGDTLNQTGLTVFAPINSAFDKLDPTTMEGLLADTDELTGILTHHVIPEQLSTADLVAGGTFETAHGHGAAVTVSMVAETLVINGGEAAVLCAEVPTANATVYLIDSVLTPPAEEEPVDTTEPVMETTGPAVETTEAVVETTEAAAVTSVAGTVSVDEDGGQIEIPEGTTTASVEGTTSNQSFDSWSVAGEAGQVLDVAVTSEGGNVIVDVFSTNGDVLADDQTSASVELPADGLYAIEVRTGADSADYILTVTLSG